MTMVLEDADDHVEGQKTSAAQLTEMAWGSACPPYLSLPELQTGSFALEPPLLHSGDTQTGQGLMEFLGCEQGISERQSPLPLPDLRHQTALL